MAAFLSGTISMFDDGVISVMGAACTAPAIAVVPAAAARTRARRTERRNMASSQMLCPARLRSRLVPVWTVAAIPPAVWTTAARFRLQNHRNWDIAGTRRVRRRVHRVRSVVPGWDEGPYHV